jgi:hypothetical protein
MQFLSVTTSVPGRSASRPAGGSSFPRRIIRGGVSEFLAVPVVLPSAGTVFGVRSAGGWSVSDPQPVTPASSRIPATAATPRCPDFLGRMSSWSVIAIPSVRQTTYGGTTAYQPTSRDTPQVFRTVLIGT